MGSTYAPLPIFERWFIMCLSMDVGGLWAFWLLNFVFEGWHADVQKIETG